MAVKVPDFERLYAKLNNTKLQTTNTSLWELIRELIGQLVQFAKSIASQSNASTSALEGFRLRTYITVNNEAAYFPFSRQLLPGTNITFDDTVDNVRVINATGGGGGSTHYDSPLSDGDPIAADLIFAAGECIIVQVPV
jgi:hypothetical protein